MEEIIKNGTGFVCPECGGKNVELKAWVDANTYEYISEAESDTYCRDCDENDLGIVLESEYIRVQALSRRYLNE